MMYTIVLEQADFLRYQLFTASKSKMIKRRRLATWLMLSAIGFCIGFLMLRDSDDFLGYYFIGFGLVTFILFPFYQRIQYKKHYLKFINENYQNRFGLINQVGLKNGFVISITDASEGKLKIEEIAEVNEISENLFIKFKTGDSLIIPSRISDYDSFKQEFRSAIAELSVSWNTQLDWEWR